MDKDMSDLQVQGETFANAAPNLHLLMTCLVTNIRRDGSISPNDRAKTLIECLRSLRELTFSSASIYISIGEDIELSELDIQEEIMNLAGKVTFRTRRLETFRDWKQAAAAPEVQDSDAVLLLSYEDHILLPGRGQVVMEAVREVNRATKAFPAGNFISILSHFPEQQILQDCWSAIGFRVPVHSAYAIPAPTPIGCLVTQPHVLASWFSQDFTEGKRIVAPENYFGPSVSDSRSLSLSLTAEAFFHKDGYGHVNLSGSYADKSVTTNPRDLGLLGRSNTWQANSRLQPTITFGGYVKSQLKNLSFVGFRLVLRSCSLWLVGKATRSKPIGSLIRVLVLKNPTFTHYLSMGFSHGLTRYLFIVIRAYTSKLAQARK